jgi:hypothetical protein
MYARAVRRQYGTPHPGCRGPSGPARPLCWQPLHQTTSRTRAVAALPRVIGGPGVDLRPAAPRHRCSLAPCRLPALRWQTRAAAGIAATGDGSVRGCAGRAPHWDHSGRWRCEVGAADELRAVGAILGVCRQMIMEIAFALALAVRFLPMLRLWPRPTLVILPEFSHQDRERSK